MILKYYVHTLRLNQAAIGVLEYANLLKIDSQLNCVKCVISDFIARIVDADVSDNGNVRHS